MILYIFLGLIISIVLAYILVNKFAPSFGGDVDEQRQKLYSTSAHYKEGKFLNTDTLVPKNTKISQGLRIFYKVFTDKTPHKVPAKEIEVITHDSTEVASFDKNRLIWFGHSSFLLQHSGQNILIDPMFSKVAAPFSFLGKARFNSKMPVEVDKMNQIDAVIYSHDHYDHLDYATVLQIKHKVKHFFVPLGVGVHLEKWGVSYDKITELDWWQDTTYQGIKLICTPAQHFSGRKASNGQSTLWSSWVIQLPEFNLFFSGDSGYATHFKEIGTQYGPFDLALMECGQYNAMWDDIHMMPEETAQAGIDLHAKEIMPIHWASFRLALHHWKDPIRRVLKKAEELDLKTITPSIGQSIPLDSTSHSYHRWWKELE